METKFQWHIFKSFFIKSIKVFTWRSKSKFFSFMTKMDLNIGD